MAVEIRLQRDQDATPWGFRLAGGADYDVPLTVTKVLEASIADEAGMQTGDILVRIGDKAMAGLTHGEAHEVLVNAGNDFVLAVRRGHWDDLPAKDVILRVSPVPEEQVVQDSTDVGNQEESQAENCPLFDAAEVSQEIQETTVERKWSTFLQKPNNPKPVPKRAEERSTGTPYRVVIVKGKKKSQVEETEDVEVIEEEEEEEDNQVQVNGLEHETDEEEEPETERVEDSQQFHVSFEENLKDQEQVAEEEEEGPEELQEVSDQDQTSREPILSLQERLAQVQNQLLSMSELPVELEQTLKSVTEQLASIVKATLRQPEEKEEDDRDEQLSVATDPSERYEDVQEDEEDQKSFMIYDSDSEKMVELVVETNVEENEDPDDRNQVEEQINEEEELLKLQEEEQKPCLQESMQIVSCGEVYEQELEEHRQRRLEHRPTQPLMPVQRPIILPGGRKWSEPEDAQPKRRHPSMTDEKICKTIEAYSETISGHLKGINFLKYQPAPKNLDFLQKSEVFRLIHDAEQLPPRGIAARPPIIPAEQDYHTQKPAVSG